MSAVLVGPRHLRVVRRRARGRRRRPRRRARPAGRSDRPERRRQDDLHRRRHRVRAAPRHGRARRGGRHPACRPTPAPGAGWPARGRRSSCSTTCPCARTSPSPPATLGAGRRSRSCSCRPVGAIRRGRRGARSARARRARRRDAGRAHPGSAQDGRCRPSARGRPKLLLLDEPAAGLDAHESAALGRQLREVVDRGTRSCSSTTTWGWCSGSATRSWCSSSAR